jgi:hypothetical protein
MRIPLTAMTKDFVLGLVPRLGRKLPSTIPGDAQFDWPTHGSHLTRLGHDHRAGCTGPNSSLIVVVD